MTIDLDKQTKVTVPRELFVEWVEKAFKKFQDEQRLKLDIRRVFQKCGLDPYTDDTAQLDQHLQSLSKEALYMALLEGQTGLNFVDI